MFAIILSRLTMFWLCCKICMLFLTIFKIHPNCTNKRKQKYLFSVIGDMIFWIDRARLTGSVSYLLKIISICRMILSYWGPRLSRACVVRILKIYEFFRLKNGIENRLNYKWLIFSLDSCTSIIFSIFFMTKGFFRGRTLPAEIKKNLFFSGFPWIRMDFLGLYFKAYTLSDVI